MLISSFARNTSQDIRILLVMHFLVSRWRDFDSWPPEQSNKQHPSQHTVETLNAESQRLSFASAASSTWSSYRTGLRAFDKFWESQNFVHNWPLPLPHLIAFTAFMSIKKLAFSTARLYIASIISALHKLHNLTDSTAHFLICKLLEGFAGVTPSRLGHGDQLPVAC